MQRRRRSKYKREGRREARPAHRWLPADTLLLAKVAEYRYATTAMLSAITGLSRLTVNRRTHRLWQHRYLGRRHLAHPRSGGGSSPSIHVLDEQGLAWLSEQSAVAERHLRSLPPATTHTPTAERELEHSLMRSHVHAAVEAACADVPELHLDFWHNESPHYYTTVSADGQRYSVRPDAFCQISIFQDEWTPYPLLFEFDRSTMDHTTMRRKYRGYFVLWRDHLRASGILPEFDGIERFRVATITEKAARYQVEAQSDRLSNLVTDAYHADDRGFGSRLFWFARLDDLPLERPLALLDAIWYVGDTRTDARHSLLPVQGVPARPVKGYASASGTLDMLPPAMV